MTITPERASRTLSDLIAEEIRVALTRQRKSQRQFAAQLGVSPAWLNYRLTGVQEIGVNDLALIAAGLGLGVYDLLPPPEVVAGATTSGLNKNLARPQVPARKHVARTTGGRPSVHTRTDSVRPVSAVPLNKRRPVSVRPPARPMAS